MPGPRRQAGGPAGSAATTLSRRSGTVEVPEFARAHSGPIHLVIDSTGLKIVGDGEWHAHKHRTSNKRRSWRKLHLGVDAEGFISDVFAPTIVIPPRKTASPSTPADEVLLQRDAAIERIAEVGRRQWRKDAGAHQQARAENGMYRYKRIIGDALRGKTLATQRTEAKIGVLVINRMTALGMPVSVPVAA